MWKILFLTILVAAFADAKFELKGRPRQRLQKSLEDACEKYSQKSEAEKTYEAVMTAVSCLYSDREINLAFKKLNRINSSEALLAGGRALCGQRHKILPCYRIMLEATMPCAPPAVRAQIDTMQQSIETLAEYVCADDCAKIRTIVDDGGFECVDAKENLLKQCTANLTDLTVELPEDTTTFAAIDACYRYDSMVTCVNEVLKSCPESALKFLSSVFTQFRQGTYCHVTLPLEKNDDLTRETTDKNAENNDNKL